jgi:hypothetical protein
MQTLPLLRVNAPERSPILLLGMIISKKHHQPHRQASRNRNSGRSVDAVAFVLYFQQAQTHLKRGLFRIYLIMLLNYRVDAKVIGFRPVHMPLSPAIE